MVKYLMAAAVSALAVVGFTFSVYASPTIEVTGLEQTSNGSVQVECSITDAADSQRITVISCEAADETYTEDVVFIDEFEAEISDEGIFTFEFEPASWVTYGKSYILRIGGGDITEPAELAIVYSNDYIVVTGDVDGDDEVTITDATLIMSYLVDKYEIGEDYKENADVDGDDEITITDATLIMSYLVDKYSIN